ncbi:MAG: metallophosphoesterase family protein [Minicystis sp.]
MTNIPNSSIDLSTARRVGLIGDVHTEAEILERAIRDLRALGADIVLCVGDIANGCGDLARCCDLLEHHDVLTVRGNHDRWLLNDLAQDPEDPAVRRRLPAAVLTHLTHLRRDVPARTVRFLTSLPATRTFATRRGELMLCHGLGANDVAGITPDQAAESVAADIELQALLASAELRIVLNGHTHHRMVRHFDHLTIVNAGTLHPAQEPGAVLLNLAEGSVLWLPLAEGSASGPEILGALARVTGSGGPDV